MLIEAKENINEKHQKSTRISNIKMSKKKPSPLRFRE
jgi:hypothetical protein